MNDIKNVYYTREVNQGENSSHYKSDTLVDRRLVFRGTKDKCRDFFER